jgi:hypothetical protein
MAQSLTVQNTSIIANFADISGANGTVAPVSPTAAVDFSALLTPASDEILTGATVPDATARLASQPIFAAPNVALAAESDVSNPTAAVATIALASGPVGSAQSAGAASAVIAPGQAAEPGAPASETVSPVATATAAFQASDPSGASVPLIPANHANEPSDPAGISVRSVVEIQGARLPVATDQADPPPDGLVLNVGRYDPARLAAGTSGKADQDATGPSGTSSAATVQDDPTVDQGLQALVAASALADKGMPVRAPDLPPKTEISLDAAPAVPDQDQASHTVLATAGQPGSAPTSAPPAVVAPTGVAGAEPQGTPGKAPASATSGQVPGAKTSTVPSQDLSTVPGKDLSTVPSQDLADARSRLPPATDTPATNGPAPDASASRRPQSDRPVANTPASVHADPGDSLRGQHQGTVQGHDAPLPSPTLGPQGVDGDRPVADADGTGGEHAKRQAQDQAQDQAKDATQQTVTVVATPSTMPVPAPASAPSDSVDEALPTQTEASALAAPTASPTPSRRAQAAAPRAASAIVTPQAQASAPRIATAAPHDPVPVAAATAAASMPVETRQGSASTADEPSATPAMILSADQTPAASPAAESPSSAPLPIPMAMSRPAVGPAQSTAPAVAPTAGRVVAEPADMAQPSGVSHETKTDKGAFAPELLAQAGAEPVRPETLDQPMPPQPVSIDPGQSRAPGDATPSATTTAANRANEAMVADLRNRAVERQVLSALKQGKDEVRLSLYPPALGQVVIRLTLEGQRVRVGLKTVSEDASGALASGEEGLRSALGAQGFSLDGFDISQQNEGERKAAPQTPYIAATRSGSATPDAFSIELIA